MPELELLYFPIHGRALLIRMLLIKGKVPFKDLGQRMTFPDFGKLKSSTY